MNTFAKTLIRTTAAASIALAGSNSWAIPLTLTVGHNAGKVSTLSSQPAGGNIVGTYGGVFDDSHSTMPIMSFLSKHFVFGHGEGSPPPAPKAPPSTGNEPEGGSSGVGGQDTLVRAAQAGDPASPVPVPGTVALLGIGLVALGRGLRRIGS